MKARFVRELTDGARVDSSFVLRAKEMRSARTGQAYLAMELADKTGSIPAVHFRPSQAAVEAPAGVVVNVTGTVTTFRGTKRISVDSLMPAERYCADDLVASSPRPLDEMQSELSSLVRSVAHAGLRSVLRAVFSDKGFFESFCRCPGAQAHHHAYLGGLIEHTVAVARTCAEVAERYEGVDRDLLVSAALLHDVGKVGELAFDTGIVYTDEGRLLGHVVLGMNRVREAAAKTRIAPDVLMRLEHAILSHHGELEWGSPKRPSTMEALLLHHVDNLDAKAAGFAQALAGATLAEESWTDAGNLFRRPLYAPRPAEDDRPHPAGEDDQHVRLSA